MTNKTKAILLAVLSVFIIFLPSVIGYKNSYMLFVSIVGFGIGFFGAELIDEAKSK